MIMGTVQMPPRSIITGSDHPNTASAVFEMGPNVVHWSPPTSCIPATIARTYQRTIEERVRPEATRGRQSESRPDEEVVKKNAYRAPTTGTLRIFSESEAAAGGENGPATGEEEVPLSTLFCTGDTLLVLRLLRSIRTAM